MFFRSKSVKRESYLFVGSYSVIYACNANEPRTLVKKKKHERKYKKRSLVFFPRLRKIKRA